MTNTIHTRTPLPPTAAEASLEQTLMTLVAGQSLGDHDHSGAATLQAPLR